MAEEIFSDLVADVPVSKDNRQIRCQGCGRFTSVKTGGKYHFIPDSECGPEESYWECERCK